MCVGPRAPIVYTKDQLIALRSVAVLPRDRHEIPAEILRKTRRGCRAGRKHREKKRRARPVLPSVITGNVRSIQNKADELTALTRFQREYRDSCIMLFTETWLTPNITDSAIAMDNFHLIRADRTAECGKRRGGGLAVFVNGAWCKPGHCTVKEQMCNKDIELLAVSMRPYYLPREFSHVIVIAVYVPPSANADNACEALLSCTSRLQTQHPQALFLVSGDFNHSSPKTVLPTFTSFYDSVVASAILYGVVCWSSSITERDKRRLDKVIRKSSSVLGCALDSVQEVGDRRVLARFTSMLDLESHPLQGALSALESSFSDRLIHSRCVKERFRRSFLPAAVRLYNEHC